MSLNQAKHDQLLAEAAQYGPGFRGEKLPATDAIRDAITKQFEEALVPIPNFISAPTEWKTRQAKLFETGDYPDKGIEITVQDLDRLVENFTAPVPILIEHSESAVEFGYLTNVKRKGAELFGEISLTADADSLIERSGAKALSVGLSRNLKKIKEVSLVQKPRIPTARIFSVEDLVFAEVELPSNDPASLTRLNELATAGKILPRQFDLAKAILACANRVCFAIDEARFDKLFLDFVEQAEPHTMFAQHSLAGGSPPRLEPDVESYYRSNFEGLSLEEIAKRLP